MTTPHMDHPSVTLSAGTTLYHGTRWRPGDVRWWEGSSPFPNQEGEDGGVSFTLHPDASPKTRNADVVLGYQLEWDVNAFHCSSKGEFYPLLKSNPENVCYASAEEEVVFSLEYVAEWLRFAGVVRERDA